VTINEQGPVLRSVYEGHVLHTYQWKPSGDIKALLCVCHGIHEYMGRYEQLGNYLKDNNILMFGIDLVGHGRSEGLRGYVDNLEHYATDIINYIDIMKSQYPSLPMFLMGQASGGLIALSIVLQRQELFTGLILFSPLIAIDPNVAGPIKKGIGKILYYIAPKLYMQPIDYRLVSSIPEEADAYNNDPLVIHTLVRARVAVGFGIMMSAYKNRLSEISLPLLIMHGSGDRMIPLSASEVIYNNTSSTDKTFEVMHAVYYSVY
jgi:alpha-beta hydrolase superfamily lysophospholipase